MKICTECNLAKKLENFEKNRNQCKDCRKYLKKKYYENNKERELLRCENYRKENKEKIREVDRKYYENNKDKVINRVKNYSNNNKEIIKERKKEYYYLNKDNIKNNNSTNKEIKKINRIKYTKANRDKINEYQRNYFKIRRENDPLFKLSCNVRSLIRQLLANNGYKKCSKSVIILGCSFDDFKKYLESQFESWMSWENYGKYNGELNYGWDIDHIIPVSTGITEQEILKLNYYTNLQPLCSKTNRDIKRNTLLT